MNLILIDWIKVTQVVCEKITQFTPAIYVLPSLAPNVKQKSIEGYQTEKHHLCLSDLLNYKLREVG